MLEKILSFLKVKWVKRYGYPIFKLSLYSTLTFLFIYLEPKIQSEYSVYLLTGLVIAYTLLQFSIEKLDSVVSDFNSDNFLDQIIQTFSHELLKGNYSKFRITLFKEERKDEEGKLVFYKRYNGDPPTTEWKIHVNDVKKCEGIAGRAWYFDQKVLRYKENSRKGTKKKADELFIDHDKFLERQSNGKGNPKVILGAAIKMQDNSKIVLVIDSFESIKLPINSSIRKLGKIIKITLEEL